MSNLRIVSRNAVDEYLTLTASSEAGSLVSTNLTNDLKSKIWRGTSLSETITVTWADAQDISMVALPLCSFGVDATIRVKLYTNVLDGSPVLDTGAVLCCEYTRFDSIDWGDSPLGVNAYYYGGGTYASVWFASQSVKKIEVIIDDSSNTNILYLEASRLVAGGYWSPAINADYGVSLESVDRSKHYRNESGDLKSDRGVTFKRLSIQLSNMSLSDRTSAMEIIQYNGKHRPLYMSLFPESSFSEDEQFYQIYGKISSNNRLKRTSFERSQDKITIEEI